MLPVLGGEVEEREQHVGVLLQGRDRLGVLGPVLGSEPLRRVARLLAGEPLSTDALALKP
jgi:hypothetical protein